VRLKVLSIIPARGRSKGVPQKNVRLLAGKPLIAWTIETALACHSLHRIIVSTDGKEIARIARDYGAEVPFLRPAELAQDDTPGIVPIFHAIRWLEKHERYRPDYVIALQPTSPLRTAQDIETALKLAKNRHADSVVSVCEAKHHPYWTKRVTSGGKLVDFFPLNSVYTRRQDLPPAHVLNGAIYLARRDVLLQKETWYTDKTYAYVMPLERSLDVDSPSDLYLVDLILRDRMKHENF
jgi:N-acylneuraminate cytidylyltransferase/CMP-N,N'-diacetyllegionaminic acid synthase